MMKRKWISPLAVGFTLLVAGCDEALVTDPNAASKAVSAESLSKRAEFHPGTRTSDGIPSTFASAIELDIVEKTITLPLFYGQHDGEAVFYIITESSEFDEAVKRGVNWAPKLANALGTNAVQLATSTNPAGIPAPFTRGRRIVQFAGTVDFSPVRTVVPGPDGFPVDPSTQAGSVGDADYSPLFTTGNGIVYNAPHLANASGRHDDVLSIDYDAMEVTLRLFDGFYETRRVLYLSTESSNEDQAALESATFAPNLDDAPAAGNRDPSLSAREPIIPVVNGAMGEDNPDRQGLRSAVAGEGDPLNIIREEQECGDTTDCSALFYSPLWDPHPVVWRQEAVDDGLRRRLTTHVDVIQLFQQGDLVSPIPEGVNVNANLGGLRAIGFVVNCPVVFAVPDPEEE